jgi:uncharacterized membrane protein YfcA
MSNLPLATRNLPLKTILVGLLAGFASGLFGIGGGLVLVPAMVYFLKVKQHTAQGTALMVILPTTICGTFYYYQAGFLDLGYLVWTAAGAMLGVLLGSTMAHELHPELLRRGFGLLMIVAAVKMFLG